MTEDSNSQDYLMTCVVWWKTKGYTI